MDRGAFMIDVPKPPINGEANRLVVADMVLEKPAIAVTSDG